MSPGCMVRRSAAEWSLASDRGDRPGDRGDVPPWRGGSEGAANGGGLPTVPERGGKPACGCMCCGCPLLWLATCQTEMQSRTFEVGN